MGSNLCSKCMAAKMLVIGGIILVTAYKWPEYIWHVIGGIIILKGLLIFLKPGGCGCCEVKTAAPKGKKK